MSTGKFLAGWLGITTLCALGAHYLYPTFGGLTGKLQVMADAEKTAQNADWASISLMPEGQHSNRIAYVRGAAPSAEAKAALETAILSRHGQLGVSTGGIKKVIFMDAVAAAAPVVEPAPAAPVEPVAAAPVPAPEPAAVAAQVDTCQADIDAAMNGKTIEFDSGKATLRETPNALLDNIAAVMAKCPDARIEIGGHTDKTGSYKVNMILSRARAAAVLDYLVSKAVPADHLTSKGYGATVPVDPAATPEAYQKNRRIAFTVSAAQPAQ
jgi:outer membrane protein OmpA-like peptidoglycan-associated protein